MKPKTAKKLLITAIIIAAALTAAICFIVFAPQGTTWQYIQKIGSRQAYLASMYNNVESYQPIFSALPSLEKTSIKAGIISHHFLAKQLIAEFYNRISDKDISTIFVLSPDHYNNSFEKSSLGYSSKATWKTPFGELKSNLQAVDFLEKNGFSLQDTAMSQEHGISVQAPFIKNFFQATQIVPIVLKNSDNYQNFYDFGKNLQKNFGQDSILIVSSDFSHNATPEEAKKSDNKSIDALKGLSIDNIKQASSDCRQCLAVLAGYLGNPMPSFYLIDNKNSFDISGQDEGSVTSYISGFYAEKKDVRLFFAGDLMFDRGIRYYAKKGGGNDFILSNVSSILKQSDLSVVNLEGPITEEDSVSLGSKIGSAKNYTFTFDPSVAKTLFSSNIRAVSLANNHILNFGWQGLFSTEKYLEDANIDYFGAPSGKRTLIQYINGVNIAVIAYNEFAGGIKQEQKQTIEAIKNAKEQGNIVIVFSHWGPEYITEPTKSLKELAHSFIDAGADVIIGSHPHVIIPMEEYNGKRIYYSLGNFVFDQYFEENVKKGMGITVTIDRETKKINFKETKFYLKPNGQTTTVP